MHKGIKCIKENINVYPTWLLLFAFFFAFSDGLGFGSSFVSGSGSVNQNKKCVNLPIKKYKSIFVSLNTFSRRGLNFLWLLISNPF